ncbi:MAG: hypothetical protein KDA93_02970 [Planctomycetaceae bacterium]|nr:hypothetical protein [Planctomycetaceae bacterium]
MFHASDRQHSTSRLLTLTLFVFVATTNLFAEETTPVAIDSPMAPPAWAVMERALLDANAEACRLFYDKYFDERGYLLCVERWGGDDGPDDAIENCNDWPILHALGADDDVLTLYRQALEGHFRQYTEAKTVDVPFARDGMYYKEFPVMFDWLHNGEGTTVFNLQGLSDPNNENFRQRVRRFAGFYMNEDPQAPNYDAEHKIIRSLFNGSRGPLLRKATGLDWAGDPIEVEGRFKPRHGESTYEQMVEHFKDYNDVVGDHPSNLLATSLAMNAYMLTGEDKYRDWLLEYVDAWNQRMADNNGIIPTNIGLDGTIGGETEGKWYGGVYGWGFTVYDPGSGEMAHRSTFQSGFAGFMNAYILSGGDDKYIDGWRKQLDIVNSNAKMIDGQKMYPTKYGDDGWYNYGTSPYTPNAMEMYYLSWDDRDRKWLGSNGWLDYLEGKNPDYPIQILQTDFANIRYRHQMMVEDTTTPDTRLADDPMPMNPASVRSLIELMLGGIHPGHKGSIIHCRARYFDPVNRRAGVPDDVSALVEKLTKDSMTLTLVNTNPVESREVLVQAGGYGEHQFTNVSVDGADVDTDSRLLRVRLSPGSGKQLHVKMRRYANDPTMILPWDR